MSTQRDPQASCEGKQRFGSYSDAEKACRRPNRHQRRIVAYHCPFCRGWHRGGVLKRSLTRWYRRREELRRAGVADAGE